MTNARGDKRARSILISLIALGACDTSVDQPNGSIDAGPSVECLEANDHSDLAWVQEKIFTPTCSNFNACHKGRALTAGGLNLEAGNAADNLIDQMSKSFPAETLVSPGDPMNSYLMVVLGSNPGPLDPDVGTMPYNSALLCVEKRAALERWITGLIASGTDAGMSDAGMSDAGTLDAGSVDALVTDATSLDAP